MTEYYDEECYEEECYEEECDQEEYIDENYVEEDYEVDTLDEDECNEDDFKDLIKSKIEKIKCCCVKSYKLIIFFLTIIYLISCFIVYGQAIESEFEISLVRDLLNVFIYYPLRSNFLQDTIIPSIGIIAAIYGASKIPGAVYKFSKLQAIKDFETTSDWRKNLMKAASF